MVTVYISDLYISAATVAHDYSLKPRPLSQQPVQQLSAMARTKKVSDTTETQDTSQKPRLPPICCVKLTSKQLLRGWVHAMKKE